MVSIHRSSHSPSGDVGFLQRLTDRVWQSLPFRDIDGSLIQGLDNRWWAWFGVELEEAWEHRPDRDKLSANRHQKAMFEGLVGRSVRIEVLSFPASEEELALKTRVHEGFDLDNKKRAQEASSTAGDVVEAGEQQTRGYIGIELSNAGRRKYDTTGVAELDDEARFYLTNPRNYWLVGDAKKVSDLLKASWRDVWPLSPGQCDEMILRMVWRGQQKVVMPGQTMDPGYYGSCDIDDRHPGDLEITYHGAKSFVSFVPFSKMPTQIPFSPDFRNEWGFAGIDGQRVDFSWHFSVIPPKMLLDQASDKKADAIGHAENLAKTGGDKSDLDATVTMVKKFQTHARTKPSVRGYPMLVVSRPTRRELETARTQLLSAYAQGSPPFTLVVPQHGQKKMWMRSIPGSKAKFNRYIQELEPQSAAACMPYVTSAIKRTGPDLLGFIRGVERRALFDSLDMALASDINKSPLRVYVGPSGLGKTTTLLDQIIPMARRGWAVLVDDLAKADTRLLEELPDVEVNQVNLADYPGVLNPALLAPDKESRRSQVTDFLVDCCGEDWQRDWRPDLDRAVQWAIQRADDRGSELPSLLDVVQRLNDGGGGGKFERDIASSLNDIATNTTVAPIFFHDRPAIDLAELFGRPGLHILQFEGLKVPTADIEPKNYKPGQRLAMAGLELSSILGLSFAYRRNVRTVHAKVEFNVTGRLRRGQTYADYMARIGRALQAVTAIDTQNLGDIHDDLWNHVTSIWGFQPETEIEAVLLCQRLSLRPTRARVDEIMSMAGDSEHPMPGTAFAMLAGRRVVKVQGQRYYVGERFITNQNERREREELMSVSQS